VSPTASGSVFQFTTPVRIPQARKLLENFTEDQKQFKASETQSCPLPTFPKADL
jgi:hypothetical protein